LIPSRKEVGIIFKRKFVLSKLTAPYACICLYKTMFDVQCLSESLDVDTEGMQGITLQRIADLVLILLKYPIHML
jgi:hypothetical protein